MLTNMIFYLSIVLSVVCLSVQNLNKRALRPGLGDLNFNFLKLPVHLTSAEGDKNLCHCSGATALDVVTIKYQSSHSHSIVLCMCPNAVTGASHMIDTMGKVPYEIRRYNKAMISATAGKCGGAGSSGDVSFYCGRDMHVSVFIHESAHSMDRGKSASNEWRNAITHDSCVPDPYANSNYAECFAQVVVLWTYLVGKGRNRDFGGEEYACMKNQLQLMAKYLPESFLENRNKYARIDR